MSDQQPASADQSQEQTPPDQDGQVSEVQRLDQGDSDTPISPADATAGYPDSESGTPDTQGAGPDAVPPENRRDNDQKPGGPRPGDSLEDEGL